MSSPGGGKNSDGGGRDQLHGTGIDGKEGAHRIGSGTGTLIERFQILHRTQAKGGGGISEAEHIGRDIHHHRSHGRMVGGNFWKNTDKQRA